jgi:HSP20 family protein
MAWELMNTDPFKDIEKARSEMDRLMDTFLFGVPQRGDFWEETEWLPPVDVAETKNEIVVNVEAPGMDPKEFEISLKEGTLTIKGEKKQEKVEGEEDYHIVERRYGTFTRSVLLPQEVQSDKISASYKNGVLTVTAPKSEGAKRKEIKIKVE